MVSTPTPRTTRCAPPAPSTRSSDSSPKARRPERRRRSSRGGQRPGSPSASSPVQGERRLGVGPRVVEVAPGVDADAGQPTLVDVVVDLEQPGAALTLGARLVAALPPGDRQGGV